MRDFDIRKRDWLVKATALASTRWLSMLSLAPASESLCSFMPHPASGTYRVAARHLPLLADAFVEDPRIDSTFPMMLRLLGNYKDRRVDRFSLSVLEGLLAMDEPPGWTEELMWRILVRFDPSKIDDRNDHYDSHSFDSGKGHLQEVWEPAKKELGIPAMSPATIDLAKYWLFGGRYPQDPEPCPGP